MTSIEAPDDYEPWETEVVDFDSSTFIRERSPSAEAWDQEASQFEALLSE